MNILTKLSKRRIVSFELDNEKKQLNVYEACDYWYNVYLSKIEVKHLIDELTEIYETMSEKG
jgi:hypothetical protein